MDIDFTNAAAEDPMDMMMLMQMELISNDHYNNINLNIQTPNLSSPTIFINPQYPPTIPFSGGSHQGPSPQNPTPHGGGRRSSVAAMREMIFRIAAMQPVHIDPEAVKPPPKRKNVKISTDPQSVAARHRRERISEKIRILQRLVPGGTKMDTASMLDEAIHYVKFLKNQVRSLERVAAHGPAAAAGIGFPVAVASGDGNYFPVGVERYHDQ